MRRFLVIEPTRALPEWVAKLVGRYLPPTVRWEGELCGVSGRCITIADRVTTSGKARLMALIRQAQAEGNVCVISGASDELVKELERATDEPIVTGQLLTVALRLVSVLERMPCDSLRVLLYQADCSLGQAVTGYLATRVRFLAITGKREAILTRLANRLWLTQGIAVTVGECEADIVLSIDKLCRKIEWVTVGDMTLPTPLVEAAYLARMARGDKCRLTQRRIAGLMRFIREYEVRSVGENADA